MDIEVVINGQAQSIPEGETVLALLQRLHLDPSRVAVELDRRIVKQPRWSETPVHAGAQIEIVQFVGGG